MDNPQNLGGNFNCGNTQMPSFSLPFLQFQCPIDPNTVDPFSPGSAAGDNELLLKDPVLRQRAMQNTLDCHLYESNVKRELAKGPDYGRASGSYYRAVQQPLGQGDVSRQYCRGTSDMSSGQDS